MHTNKKLNGGDSTVKYSKAQIHEGAREKLCSAAPQNHMLFSTPLQHRFNRLSFHMTRWNQSHLISVQVSYLYRKRQKTSSAIIVSVVLPQHYPKAMLPGEQYWYHCINVIYIITEIRQFLCSQSCFTSKQNLLMHIQDCKV